MKNQSRNPFISKFSLNFKSLPSIVETGASTLESFPGKTEFREIINRKPYLEEGSGMSDNIRDFISRHCLASDTSFSILRTSACDVINSLPEKTTTIVNLKRVNDIREINKFLSAVNRKLPEGGTFIGCVETKYMRKQRIFRKFPPVLNRIYYVLDFILKRVFPKLALTRWMYFMLTAGRNKVMSKTEALGRLYAAGFEIKEKEFIGNNLFFVVKKVKKPLFQRELKYGPMFKMRRHGKNGKLIYIYKMRTMHAYSEFIQQYVYEKNKLAEGGKINDDFRVSSLGKFFRKYWIDELPMIYNVLKGDLKLIGVRPLSTHYLGLYSNQLKEIRSRHKPGLIPPFYADIPKTLNDIQESEMRYLSSYEKSPLLTDMRYFFKAAYNILIKKARSK